MIEVFRNPAYARLFSAQVIALVGTGLTTHQIIFAVISFAAFVVFELSRACGTGKVERAWFAEAVAAMGIVYFLMFGVIAVESSVCMYLALGAGILLWSVGRFVERRPHAAVLSQPFMLTGTLLPLLTSSSMWIGLQLLLVVNAAVKHLAQLLLQKLPVWS